jgi:hypothetical protein
MHLAQASNAVGANEFFVRNAQKPQNPVIVSADRHFNLSSVPMAGNLTTIRSKISHKKNLDRRRQTFQ